MRALNFIETNLITGGSDPISYQEEFWTSFLSSSGYYSGIVWSPIMPLVMGSFCVFDLIVSATWAGLSWVHDTTNYLVGNSSIDC